MTPELLTPIFFEATERRKVCRIRLKSETDWRVIYPFGICMNPRKKIMLVAWQESGYASKSPVPGYRNFNLMEIEEVETTDRRFIQNKDFNPDDSQYSDWVYHI